MDAFLEDGSHEATISVIRALVGAVPHTTERLREYILLTYLQNEITVVACYFSNFQTRFPFFVSLTFHTSFVKDIPTYRPAITEQRCCTSA